MVSATTLRGRFFRYSIVNGVETVLLAMSEVCSNPLCKKPVVTHPKALHPRRFCSNGCRLKTYMLVSVAKMLLPLGPAKAWEILQGLREGSALDLMKNGNSQGRVRGEIVPPGANLGDVS